MFTDLTGQKELLPALAASVICIVFLLYYYLTILKHPLRLPGEKKPLTISKESLEFISGKVTGLILFGLIPYILFIYIIRLPPQDIGVTFGNMKKSFYLLALLISIAIILPCLLSRNRNNRLFGPELKVSVWKPRHYILAASGWLIYLLGYEFIFRGVLWSIWYNAYGFRIALGINILLYSAVHIPKGKLVTLGAIPVGALLCFLAYKTGSFLPAFFIHSAMAISGELFSAYSGQAVNQNHAILRR